MTINNAGKPTPNSVRGSGARVSRRTLVAGTAWAVPAVVVATAAPAMAASTASTCRYRFSFIVTGTRPTCRRQTNGAYTGYRLGVLITRDPACESSDQGSFTLTVTPSGAPPVATEVTFYRNGDTTSALIEIVTPNPVQSVPFTLALGTRVVGQQTLNLPASAQNTCA